jgi:hypothetical protein
VEELLYAECPSQVSTYVICCSPARRTALRHWATSAARAVRTR